MRQSRTTVQIVISKSKSFTMLPKNNALNNAQRNEKKCMISFNRKENLKKKERIWKEIYNCFYKLIGIRQKISIFVCLFWFAEYMCPNKQVLSDFILLFYAYLTFVFIFIFIFFLFRVNWGIFIWFGKFRVDAFNPMIAIFICIRLQCVHCSVFSHTLVHPKRMEFIYKV